MSWEPQPVIKRMVWVLDGTKDSPFDIELNDRVTMSAGVYMTQYTVLDAPVTSGIPNHPAIYLQMGHMLSGLTLSGCVSNTFDINQNERVTIPMDATHVALSGANTNVQMQPGKQVGTMKGGETRAFKLHVRDMTGADHKASTNRLFRWAIFEFEIQETPHARNPLYLVNKVPTIQQTLDTI